MSDQPQPPPPESPTEIDSSAWAPNKSPLISESARANLGCLGILGALLLLPGLCSLIVAIESLNNAGGLLGDPKILALWGFLISAAGIALIFFAIRLARRS
jgi:hypothetical protein